MSFLDSLCAGLRALHINKLRSLLTLLGMIVGVAAVICMVSVGAGAEAEVSETIRTLGANLLLVRPGAQRSGGARLEAGTRHTLIEADASAIHRQLLSVRLVAPLVSRPMQIVAGSKNWSTLIAGVNSDYLVARDWRIMTGRAFTADELETGTKVAIIGSVVADHLFGSGLGIGETLRLGSVPFTVIAVLDKKGQGAAGRSQDDVVFIPLSAAQSRVLGAVHGNSREALDLILIKASDPLAIPELKSEVNSLLRQRHRLTGDAPDDFDIENPADVLTVREGALRTLSFLLTSVASVSLMVGGIGIMNIMLVSVTERTREIGLRMAVGARRRDISRQFLTEAVTLALAGGLFGTVAGCIAATVLAWNAGWPVLITPAAVALACICAGLIGIFSGL